MNRDKTLTILLPVHNEAEGIYHNVQQIKKVLDEHQIPHRYLLVDDGSTDSTWQEIQKLSNRVPFHALRFSRNFGKEAAIMAGLKEVDTPVCVVMDADLQHPPMKVLEMYRLWENEGVQIVDGVKRERGKENILNRLGAQFFYRVFSKVTGFELDRASDFKLLDHRVVQALNELEERETFFRGLSTWVGFRREKVYFEVEKRVTGKSSWSVMKLFRLAIGAITSYTSLPLHLVTLFGGVFLVGSFLLGIQTLYNKFSGVAVDGFTTVILLLLIVGGSLMLSLGVIGVYIEKIYNEIKGRPRYIINQSVRWENAEGDFMKTANQNEAR